MDKQPNKRLTWLPSVAQRKKRREEQGLPSTSSSSDDTHKSIRHRLQAVYRRSKALRAIFQPRPLPSRPRSEVLLQKTPFPELPPQLPHLSLSSARLPSFFSSWSLSELPPPVPQRPPPPPQQQRCFQLPPLRPQRLPTRLPPCPGPPPTDPLPLIPVAGRPVPESGFLYADLRRRLEIYAWVDRVPAWQYCEPAFTDPASVSDRYSPWDTRAIDAWLNDFDRAPYDLRAIEAWFDDTESEDLIDLFPQPLRNAPVEGTPRPSSEVLPNLRPPVIEDGGVVDHNNQPFFQN